MLMSTDLLITEKKMSLSAREREIALLCTAGLKKEIADKLFIVEPTVKKQPWLTEAPGYVTNSDFRS